MTTVPIFDDQPIAIVLDTAGSAGPFKLSPAWWGFGGVHGGLALALLTAAMRRRADGRALRQVSAQFRRPVREDIEIQVAEEGSGKTLSWLSAQAKTNGFVAVTATATFSASGNVALAPIAPTMPSAEGPADCPIFTVPHGFAPFTRRLEIRPVGRARPFSGAKEPELTAWVRLLDDDLPPDEIRLIVLMDALAPSYGATLTAPVPIPTLTLTVTPGQGIAGASSPWILLRASTDVMRGDGWHTERLDAWSLDGSYLGRGEQLRLVPPF